MYAKLEVGFFIRNEEKDMVDEHRSREAKHNGKGFQPLVFMFWTLKWYKMKCV